LKNALSEAGQKDLWQLTKPHIVDPKDRAMGLSLFEISRKGGKAKRNVDFDNYGKLLFNLSAGELMKVMEKSGEDFKDEPAYKHLLDIANGTK
jgi:hypothetical protein